MTRSVNNSGGKGPRIPRPTITKDPKPKARARGTLRIKRRRRQDPIAPPTPAAGKPLSRPAPSCESGLPAAGCAAQTR